MITKVLAALDGSERAAGVFRTAADVADRFGAKLYLFRAVTIPPEFPAAGAGAPKDKLPEHIKEQARQDLSRQAAKELAALTARLPNVAVELPIIGVGQPWKAILEAADCIDADLIILGSHGYGGIDRILGTTAGKVANLANRNVLIVHDRS